MRFRLLLTMVAGGLLAGAVRAQKPPLLPEKDVAALANELTGETAKRNLEVLATFHRQRGSRGFHAAAELVAERLGMPRWGSCGRLAEERADALTLRPKGSRRPMRKHRNTPKG
jgi:hypothetical protein